jgi:ABC-type transport system involved in multi-copper enzyme maturation permease subunit
MFAALTIEKDQEPIRLEDLPGVVHAWLLIAGGFAAVALVVWFLVFRGPGPAREEHRWSWKQWLIAILLGGIPLALLPTGLAILWNYLGWSNPSSEQAKRSAGALLLSGLQLLEYGAGCALAAVLLPVILNLSRLRGRRIWALAKLSFMEAIRRRVLWVFSLLLLVFLFASWFFPYKPEDQVRTYVQTVYTVMSWLLLITAALLASFSLPADLRNQTIHTIVTKPVERFEIILGRFLGYTLLITLVLVVMSLFSLLYVSRGIDREAAEESYKARVPIFGKLEVQGGKNVGYEWEYREYITGGAADEFAVWTFLSLPNDLGERDSVPCEFTFDIFRTTKGEENKPIYCSFFFENWQCATGDKPGVPETLDKYRRERDELVKQMAVRARTQKSTELPVTEAQMLKEMNDYLAQKYGYYELLSADVVDFHTQAIEIPAGLFTNLPEWGKQTGNRRPPLRVTVRCDSRTQYLGVAKNDFYLLAATRGFEQNFFKGMIGLWYRLCLIIGIAITCSTCVSGVISFLATMFLYGAGLLLAYVRSVAEHQAIGGGPGEALFRLVRREHTSIPLDQTPILAVIQNADKVFEWFLGRCFLSMIPDVSRHDLTDYVAAGFNISGAQLVVNGLLLAGYLLPWIVLAYYLMRAREVAA